MTKKEREEMLSAFREKSRRSYENIKKDPEKYQRRLEQMRQYRKEHAEKMKKQKHANYLANKKEILSKKKQYRDAHKEEIRLHALEYNERTREHIKEHNREYYEKNRKHLKEYRRDYFNSHKEECLEKDYEAHHEAMLRICIYEKQTWTYYALGLHFIEEGCSKTEGFAKARNYLVLV